MSILADKETRIIVQGMTGREGSFHSWLCKMYGTNIVAGVVPGKGNRTLFFQGVWIYNTVEEAVAEQKANASIIFVPARFTKDALLEAIDAQLDLVVCITEGIPVHDTLEIKSYLKGKKTKLIGPNCPGLISPGEKTKVGIMPEDIFMPGSIGVISRSGTLTYEIVAELSKKGFGQSTCVGIGGDPIIGLNFVDCLKLFKGDLLTQAVVIVGEIGGTAEEEAAKFFKNNSAMPVVAYICGLTAPEEKRMGHAGAIVSDGKGTAKEKIEALESAGIPVARTIGEVPLKLKKLLKRA